MKAMSHEPKDHGLSRERVEAVLARIRPVIRNDGGDIELVGVADADATVRLKGRCVGCPSAHLTLYLGVERAIRDEIPGFGHLRVVA